MRAPSPHLAVPALLILLAASAVASPVLIDLDTGVLPGAQGWSFGTVGNVAGATETDCFAVVGEHLVLDTLGLPNAANCSAGGAAFYDLDLGAHPGATTWRLTLVARVTHSDVLVSPWGFCVQVALGGFQGGFGLGTDTLSPLTGSAAALDATQWHEYQMIGDVASQTFSVYVDDELVASGAMTADARTVARLGDGTCGATARAEIARYELTLDPEEPVANEAAAWGAIKRIYR